MQHAGADIADGGQLWSDQAFSDQAFRPLIATVAVQSRSLHENGYLASL